LPKYTYSVNKDAVETAFIANTGMNIYEHLGNVDFSKAILIVDAKDIYESESIRKGVTDIRMWNLESES
jgi:hypothetical protein